MGEIIAAKGKSMTSDELSVIDKTYKKGTISVRLGYNMIVDGKLPRRDVY